MINSDLYSIVEGIKKCKSLSNTANIDFAMTLARINAEVIAELKIIEAGKKEYSNKYKEYLKKRNEIEIKYSVQNEDGSIQMYNGYLLTKDIKKLNIEIEQLELEYKDEIELVIKIEKEFRDYLNKECKIKITKIAKSLFPLELTVEQAILLHTVIE